MIRRSRRIAWSSFAIRPDRTWWLRSTATRRKRGTDGGDVIAHTGGKEGSTVVLEGYVDVSGEETIALAAQHGLKNLFHERAGSIQAENRANHIEWTKLVFEKA